MSNPTSNFGWQMPTPGDLVTDLPADFEVFGQAVDTSLADLKGGTSGQILAKNSNTDMDFVWIANDQGDITGITASSPLTGGGTSGAVTIGILNGTTSNLGAVQLSDSTSSTSTTLAATANAVKTTYDLANGAIPKALIDAKGDLIAGTAADTAGRLAVGTDYKILTADSTEATGMKWTGDWISYTPVWTGASSNPDIGNGNLTGGYRRIGQQIDFWVYMGAGSTTTFGSGAWRFSLPVAATSAQWNFGYNAWILDSGVAWFKGYVGEGVDSGFSDKFEVWNPTFTTKVSSTSPMTWNANDGIRIIGSYRVG